MDLRLDLMFQVDQTELQKARGDELQLDVDFCSVLNLSVSVM
jgi:hypothetical protein